MKNDITNFLEFQGYKIISTRETSNNELIFKVEKRRKKNNCPICHKTKITMHANRNWQLKKHSNYQEKLIYLEIKRNRLRCLNCGCVFSQELPGISLYARKTDNFVKQSLNYLSKNSFNEVGKVNKTSYTPLKNQLYKYVNPHKLLENKVKVIEKQDKIYLGLDGQSFRKQEMVLTIAEVKQKELLTILPSELQSDLLKFIHELPLETRLKVDGIAMDMTNKHIKILRKYFPNAKIVIDHYHVVQNAIRHMQKIRTTLQSARKISIPIKKELDKNYEDLTDEEKRKVLKYFTIFPAIKEAYWVKERVRSVYRISKHKKAKHKFKILKNELLCSKEIELREFGRTLLNWENEILNYFKCRITNAYTEGLHTKCKLIKRKSYGFRNVDTYVRKLILGLAPLIFLTHFLT